MLDLAELKKLRLVFQLGNLGVIPEERGLAGVELHIGDLRLPDDFIAPERARIETFLVVEDPQIDGTGEVLQLLA